MDPDTEALLATIDRQITRLETQLGHFYKLTRLLEERLYAYKNEQKSILEKRYSAAAGTK